MLYPKMNVCRDVYNLNGVWAFRPVSEDYVPADPTIDCMPMAVPASMNEIVVDKNLRNYTGKVLYERYFSVPFRAEKVYRLRIGATSHKCEVYLNGKRIGEGSSGFYPIDLPLSQLQKKNRLSVVIDNRLNFQCLPVGQIVGGKQVINHDFYNFTGIHRDVLIYSLPQKHIQDIVISTAVDGDYSKIKVTARGNYDWIRFTVFDRDGKAVASGSTEDLTISDPRLWSCDTPYLYTLAAETESDFYEERFGIRKVEVKDGRFLLNGEPVYLKGFGMHEDFALIGKGNCTPVTVRNFECMKWAGANSFRTSHYPYSEEYMALADEFGFLVIDEVPAVCMKWWAGGNFTEDRINEQTKALHKELIRKLIERDKNHPCVVMLSLANEPETGESNAVPYFEDIFAYARTLTTLPLTYVNCAFFGECKCSHLPDVLCINRYYGWYDSHADISCIVSDLGNELKSFYEKYKKPIILSEFGADTIEGFHSLPSETFSEEFQVEIVEETCKLLDRFSFCIGEHVWNFADFKTKEGLTRVRGNRKGVFTRDRQPKMVAHFLRKRWINFKK